MLTLIEVRRSALKKFKLDKEDVFFFFVSVLLDYLSICGIVWLFSL